MFEVAIDEAAETVPLLIFYDLPCYASLHRIGNVLETDLLKEYYTFIVFMNNTVHFIHCTSIKEMHEKISRYFKVEGNVTFERSEQFEIVTEFGLIETAGNEQHDEEIEDNEELNDDDEEESDEEVVEGNDNDDNGELVDDKDSAIAEGPKVEFVSDIKCPFNVNVPFILFNSIEAFNKNDMAIIRVRAVPQNDFAKQKQINFNWQSDALIVTQ